LIEQETAFTHFQVKTVFCGTMIFGGLATKEEQETAGGGVTPIVTDFQAVPPGPVQVKEYDWVVWPISPGVTACPPISFVAFALPTAQSPSLGDDDATQEVTPVEVQIAVAALPNATGDGPTEKERVGAPPDTQGEPMFKQSFEPPPPTMTHELFSQVRCDAPKPPHIGSAKQSLVPAPAMFLHAAFTH
jgi:hypothetical protein